MTETHLGERYRRYLDCLNNKRFEDLVEFVHDLVVHNGHTLTIAEFQDVLRRDAAEIPDLYYAIEQLVVDDDKAACRIRFDCTPARTFRGLPSAGQPISFVEHVTCGVIVLTLLQALLLPRLVRFARLPVDNSVTEERQYAQLYITDAAIDATPPPRPNWAPTSAWSSGCALRSRNGGRRVRNRGGAALPGRPRRPRAPDK